MIRDYVLAPASAHDVALAPELLGGHDDLVVLGDKGYLSAPLTETLREEHALHLLTPPRKNMHPPQSHGQGSLWNGLRQMVETVNAQLSEQFDLARHGAHTFGGLAARLETKLAAHTLCLLMNWQLGKAAWLQIKPLAFPISHMTRVSLFLTDDVNRVRGGAHPNNRPRYPVYGQMRVVVLPRNTFALRRSTGGATFAAP